MYGPHSVGISDTHKPYNLLSCHLTRSHTL